MDTSTLVGLLEQSFDSASQLQHHKARTVQMHLQRAVAELDVHRQTVQAVEVSDRVKRRPPSFTWILACGASMPKPVLPFFSITSAVLRLPGPSPLPTTSRRSVAAQSVAFAGV